MIRPVSEHQMQRGQQPQLQSPRKPQIGALLHPSSPLKYSSTTPPKSPIKKHFQWALSPETSSIGATAASSVPAEDEPVSLSPRYGPLKAKLRASVLQSVLRLLDQDANSLAGAQEVLQAAASLPLAEPSVQRACLQALRELGASNTNGASTSLMPPSFVYESSSAVSSKWNTADTTYPVSSPRKQVMKAVQKERSSGRAKGVSVGSLHHCKEFLLACANEIHELEDDHSARFDYAEDTASSSIQHQAQPKCLHCGADFDYASTVPDSSSSIESDVRVENDSSDDGDDNTRADQGSQFSEVLRRAEYMSDMEDELSDVEVKTPSRPMLMNDRMICRQVLHAMHEYIHSQRLHRQRSSVPNFAVKYHVFEALKLQASLTRKRIAFQRLKSGLRSCHQQSQTTVLAKSQRSVKLSGLVFRTLVLHHSDILLLILAIVFLANLPAQYIV